MDELIINKVAESGIITLNLEDYLPAEGDILVFDIKPFLFREMIIKEKDFRLSIIEHNWEQYKDKNVAVTCSTDAIIPMWAFMLIASNLSLFAKSIFSGSEEELVANLMLQNIAFIAADEYQDKRIVIKGCGDKAMPEAAFLAVTQKLRPVVKSLMYGEPCSTVPVYKKK